MTSANWFRLESAAVWISILQLDCYMSFHIWLLFPTIRAMKTLASSQDWILHNFASLVIFFQIQNIARSSWQLDSLAFKNSKTTFLWKEKLSILWNPALTLDKASRNFSADCHTAFFVWKALARTCRTCISFKERSSKIHWHEKDVWSSCSPSG